MGAPRRARPADQLSNSLPDAILRNELTQKTLACSGRKHLTPTSERKEKNILEKNYNSLDTHRDFKLSRASYFNRRAI
jgi:hypothetical protein